MAIVLNIFNNPSPELHTGDVDHDWAIIPDNVARVSPEGESEAQRIKDAWLRRNHEAQSLLSSSPPLRNASRSPDELWLRRRSQRPHPRPRHHPHHRARLSAHSPLHLHPSPRAALQRPSPTAQTFTVTRTPCGSCKVPRPLSIRLLHHCRSLQIIASCVPCPFLLPAGSSLTSFFFCPPAHAHTCLCQHTHAPTRPAHDHRRNDEHTT